MEKLLSNAEVMIVYKQTKLSDALQISIIKKPLFTDSLLSILDCSPPDCLLGQTQISPSQSSHATPESGKAEEEEWRERNKSARGPKVKPRHVCGSRIPLGDMVLGRSSRLFSLFSIFSSFFLAHPLHFRLPPREISSLSVLTHLESEKLRRTECRARGQGSQESTEKSSSDDQRKQLSAIALEAHYSSCSASS